ncbi:unnamed protein product [Urochloa humidicola]
MASPAPPVNDPRPAATIVDGMQYLLDLYDEFAFTEPEKFDTIIAVLRTLTSGSMETARVVAQMEDLLSGHRDLLHSFNRFLPWSYIRAHGPAGGNIQ